MERHQDEQAQDKQGWPPRPAGECFPEVLDTTLVAQLLLYDRRGVKPENARRDVRRLVKDQALPVFGKVGNSLLFHKTDVLAWLKERIDSEADQVSP